MLQHATEEKKKKKNQTGKRKKLEDDAASISSILSANSFAALDDEMNPPTGEVGVTPKQSPQLTVSNAPSIVRKEKLPPLVVVGVKFGALQVALSKLGVKPTYNVSEHFGIKIIFPNQAGFVKTEEHLRKLKVEYYTHDKPSEKPYKWSYVDSLTSVKPASKSNLRRSMDFDQLMCSK